MRKDGRNVLEVVRPNGNDWHHIRNLMLEDGHKDDCFGYDIDSDGHTVMIGAHGHNQDTGAVYTIPVSALRGE